MWNVKFSQCNVTSSSSLPIITTLKHTENKVNLKWTCLLITGKITSLRKTSLILETQAKKKKKAKAKVVTVYIRASILFSFCATWASHALLPQLRSERGNNGLLRSCKLRRIHFPQRGPFTMFQRSQSKSSKRKEKEQNQTDAEMQDLWVCGTQSQPHPFPLLNPCTGKEKFPQNHVIKKKLVLRSQV